MPDDIVTVCKRMVADANAQLEKYEQVQKAKKAAKPVSMRTFLSGNPMSAQRTGEEQAKGVLAGLSWTCNSSHMTDAARHVGPKINGKFLDDMRKLKNAVSDEDYKKFVEIYGAAMKKQGLRNFQGGDKFLPDSEDPLHMELKDSRLPDNHLEVQKCLQTYAQATREDGKRRNDRFEKAYTKWLADYDRSHAKP